MARSSSGEPNSAGSGKGNSQRAEERTSKTMGKDHQSQQGAQLIQTGEVDAPVADGKYLFD